MKAPRLVAQVSTHLFSLFLAVSLQIDAPNSHGTQPRTAILTTSFPQQTHRKRPRVIFDWHADVESGDGL